MSDNASRGKSAADELDTGAEQTADIPIRLVGGNASPEELTAIVAVVAVLTSTVSDHDDPEFGLDDRSSARRTTSGIEERPRWNSPARMVRTTFPHGPGGWRASALRADRSRFWG